MKRFENNNLFDIYGIYCDQCNHVIFVKSNMLNNSAGRNVMVIWWGEGGGGMRQHISLSLICGVHDKRFTRAYDLDEYNTTER